MEAGGAVITRDPEQSKLRILAAAEMEFAEKGLYGARVDRIAEKAQINKRMLYAYFGDKERLYKQVLAQVYKRMELIEREIVSNQYTGQTLIRNIICAYFNFLQNNPSFVNILMWENLNHGRYLQEIEASRIERSTIHYFVAALEDGRQNGVFCSEIDPWNTAVSLITTCFANFSNQHTLSKLFHTDMTNSEIIEQRKQHTIEMVMAYLCGKNKEE